MVPGLADMTVAMSSTIVARQTTDEATAIGVASLRAIPREFLHRRSHRPI
jgi:hypothetical protein